MRRLLAVVLLAAALSGCGGHATATPRTTCPPPAGGRCAQDIAWHGPIYLTPDGRRLHQLILCGGTLHATETTDSVTIRLHLGAIGAGAMSCAKVDVGVRLRAAVGDRTVVDSVSGRVVRVVHGAPQDPRSSPTLRG
ncbi:MAG TPA: hypothetical protein VGK78_19685 [Nocardioides sp.]|uniref:hypothetical protein n=1 Tax=Nocardioides sp. TaxID=35761 RepID=UPI002F4087F3